MKKKDYLKELREMTEESLRERLRSLAEEKMKLRFRKASGQLEETHRLGDLQRQLAQANTIYREKFVAAEAK
ncbi:MAG: 50S ribosomal protein L29 [Bdellovibrionales bacterium]|nr:50S ribosomal protein L29 [Bdellovibrionales bacterium]